MKRTSLAWIWILVGAAAGISFVVSCDTSPRSLAQGLVEDSELLAHHKPPRAEKVITAETDPAQLATHAVALENGKPAFLVKGPFVITDLQVSYFGSDLFLASGDSGHECDARSETILPDIGGPTSVHGARLFVPAGKNACLVIFGGIVPTAGAWSGFRPY